MSRLDKTGANIMTKREYELIDKIQREGLDNGNWMVFDCGAEGMDSCALLGETDDATLFGRVILIWTTKDAVMDEWPTWWAYCLPMLETPPEERECVLVYPLTNEEGRP